MCPEVRKTTQKSKEKHNFLSNSPLLSPEMPRKHSKTKKHVTFLSNSPIFWFPRFEDQNKVQKEPAVTSLPERYLKVPPGWRREKEKHWLLTIRVHCWWFF